MPGYLHGYDFGDLPIYILAPAAASISNGKPAGGRSDSGNERGSPQIGRDIVKIGSADKMLETRRAGGHPRSLNAKQGTSR